MPVFQPDIESRFWSKVNKQGSTLKPKLGHCWEWQAQLNNKGYGVFRVSRPIRRSVYAHRYAVIITRGSLLDSECVMHKCDNPRCVNPKHLTVGSKLDNMRDCAHKFRVNTTELKEEQVRYLRDLLASRSSGRFEYGDVNMLASAFGVHRSTIRRAAKGISFKELP